MRSPQDKILTLEQAMDWRDQLKKEEYQLVFTNGCFDLIHLGHLDYLEKARGMGDQLLVGLNSDRSITTIKGKSRPIVDQDSRSRLLASLEFVDRLVVFDEETPEQLIRKLQPDILVKGNDYDISNIVGADIVIENGGSVKTISLVEGYSTTGLIDKIKNS